MKHLLIVALTVLSGCSYEARNSSGELDALYWHEGTRYTGKVIDDGGLVRDVHLPPFNIYETDNHLLVYTDAVPGEKAWYECNWMWNFWTGGSDGLCEIHVHSLDEVGTADWNHGKFGSGSTTRID